MVSWIIEFTIMVLSIEILSNSVGNSDKVSHVLRVADIGIKVVLEVLEHVHVLLNVLVSSDSCEGECFIVEFPGVDAESLAFWECFVNVQYIGPVSWVKGS